MRIIGVAMAVGTLTAWACPTGTELSDCRAGGPPVPPTAGRLAGSYDYLACDAANRPAVIGTVVVTASDTTFTGTWDLRRHPDGDPTTVVGPQLGSGTLTGWTFDQEIHADLNPGWADNNVGLAGALDAERTITGEWSHTTIIGPVAGGRFIMRKR
jgi:hypothetical protein